AVPGPARDRGAGVAGPVLEPYLVVVGALPAGEHAHAVGGGEDLVEVAVQLAGGQVLVDVLADLEVRHEVEGERGDDAECPQADDHAGEPAAVGVAAQRQQAAVGGDQVQGPDRGRQVAVAVARAVRSRRAGSGHRDVRQRGQVWQCPARRVQALRQVTVLNAPADGDRGCGRVDVGDRGQPGGRHQDALGVCDAAE